MSVDFLYFALRNAFFRVFGTDLPARLACAVSGGSDSMALLVASKRFSKRYGCEIIALTVDHGLRDDAHQDCDFVHAVCALNQIRCFTLKVQGPHLKRGGVQAYAREARYRLLINFCKENDILDLCTAHHADDVAENFFIRLGRSASIAGLIMQDVSFLDNIRVVRPLLSVQKSSCRKYLEDVGVSWREDSSNFDTSFSRNAVRVAIDNFCKHKHFVSQDVFLKNIAGTVRHLDGMFQAVKTKFLELFVNSVFVSHIGYATIDMQLLEGENVEMQGLLLSHVLTIIRGTKKMPRTSSVSMCLKDLMSGCCVAKSLHGCRMVLESRIIFVYRDFGKNFPCASQVQRTCVWDDRFVVFTNEKDKMDGCVVDFIYKYELSKVYCVDNLRALYGLKKSIYDGIMSSLPVIRRNDTIVGLASFLNAVDDTDRLDFVSAEVKFLPNFTSKLVHF
ncbi:tRNA lysidine(34) synthetase TilS [Candidatus Sneabacter namystus]|uniref:tRNA(Ile)-lysidine synthase n=1 Tax=Candidatus Sneabacter namystus TaxID=2601646 RepID=A0A5C0UJ25_9RICK|nr:tRNA lysidine(34) synthetase TilS [Candidatus Sneabacter namystus]QEK39513.1 tRNA lysidine(34) synthetase TilS [Candidatus Sneabacter namystus]